MVPTRRSATGAVRGGTGADPPGDPAAELGETSTNSTEESGSNQVARRTETAVRTPSRDIESALVDAAERVLVRDGPGAVTVRAVAVEAGVAPMGVYNRFGGKDGLVDALLTRGFIGLQAAVAGSDEADPAQRLLGSGVRYRQFALSHPAHYLAMFDDAIHQDTQADDVMRCARASFDELVGHVQYAMVGGLLAAGDSEEIAQQIWSTVHGAVQLEIKGMLLVPDADRAYHSLLHTLLAGLRART